MLREGPGTTAPDRDVPKRVLAQGYVIHRRWMCVIQRERLAKGTCMASKTQQARGCGCLVALVIALLILIGVIANACSGPRTPASHPQETSPSALTPSSPSGTAPAATPSPTPVRRHHRRQHHHHHVPSPTTAPPAPVGCYPLSDEGTCYKPGEFCRDSDHGVTGVAGDGETITCEDNDGWRWEPA